MIIETVYIINTGIGVAVAVVGWLLKRTFVDKLDALENKIDALSKTIHEMAMANANDHRDVVERIANIEGKLNID